MIKKFLNKKTYTEIDLLNELLKPLFNIEKLDEIFNKTINIDYLNEQEESFLHLCSKKGLKDSMQWLLKKGASTNITNKEGCTVLFYAIHANNISLLNTLIEHGANVNHLNIYKRNVLQDTVLSAKNRLVDFLIEKTKDINNCDTYGHNLIFDALANGDIDTIIKITKLKNLNINQKNNDGNTVLHKEIILKNNELAILLMDLGMDPTIQDKKGKNFLFYAVSKGIQNANILEKAVSLGCNINSRSAQNSTILMESINHFLNTNIEDTSTRASHLEMIKKLIAKGVKIDALDDQNETAFFKATRSENKDLIELFISSRKIDINHQNIKGESVLFSLIYKGLNNLELIKMYLNKMANPNIVNKEGKSIIEILIDIILHVQNNKKITKELENQLHDNGEYFTVLLEILSASKVDLNQKNSLGKPLFFDTLMHFNYSLFKIFRDNEQNINAKDKEGRNIIFNLLELDLKSGIKNRDEYLETLQNLFNLGVNINEKDNIGDTALHKAVTRSCEYTVKLLLEAKPNFFAIDKKGRSIIHQCIWKDNSRYFKLIHSYNNEIINITDSFGVRPINYAAFMGKRVLVLDMINAGALINNDTEKTKDILKFFEKFHKNILNIQKNLSSAAHKRNLQILATTMIKEFNIKEESKQ